MKTVNQVRETFLKYFEGKGHTIEKSGPLVPQNDPTLMFTVAGMVPFKNVFTGLEKRDYTRATTSQKCLRAGGKHNDLENVGYTARHHTFFEMLGNFSFGDYFKEDAIAFGWELVTREFGLSPDKLLVTVHSSDEEAAAIWKKVTGFSDDKILRIPTDDNFWSMGDTGPCGPCTEIFYDHGDHIPGGPPGSPDEDGDRFIEIWNIVFMQFETLEGGKRIDLPKPSVDTGMGLERMAATLNGSHDNYSIDIIRNIIEHVADETGIDPDGEHKASHRVIADHLRAAVFLMADGVMPSNEGRGYVLRRIMRRGMRHAHLLGAQDPLIHKLVPTLTADMGEAYPEIRRGEKMVTEMLEMEEAKFKKTLDRGLKLLEEEKQSISSGGKLPGDVAFKLYDTYGFPLDLTQDALRADGLEVDVDGFNKSMEKQKEEARASWAGSGDAGSDKLWFEILDEAGPTDFLGYKTETGEAAVKAIVKDGEKAESLTKGEDGILITNQSPFYAESGGQVGDTGEIKVMDGDKVVCDLKVTDTKKAAGSLWLHYVKCDQGEISLSDSVVMEVDHNRRAAIKANHTVTHLMHEALRQVLGEHVQQKGSLQDAERTRFDISHPKGITEEEISRIEEIVNKEIWANTEVSTRVMPFDDAVEQGAMALFGEKYGDEVRVVSMGRQDPGANKPFSVELCGGTHVKQTGEIGLFKIISESALSSGVRRIEALTKDNALRYFDSHEKILQTAAGSVKSSVGELAGRVSALVDEKKKLENEISTLRKKLASGGGGESSAPAIKDVDGVKFSGQVMDDIPAKDLKGMADELTAKIGSGVVALITKMDGKASIVVAVTKDLTDKYNAVDLVKIGAAKLGGKGGGGRPDMAQAGGPNPGNANDAVAAIEKALAG